MEFSLSELKSLSSATKALIDKDESILSLLDIAHPFLSYDKAIELKKDFSIEIRNILVAELKNQYNFLSDNSESFSKVNANIDKLKHTSTYTVCTGQQLHLFLGPAFVIYKILAVIQLCETLKIAHPDCEFVPVYWLASEDHDFEEIKDTTIFNKKFTWNTKQKGACGRFNVTEVKILIDEIRASISLNQQQLDLLDKLENIYSSSTTLSEASIRLVQTLFGEYGLICIDADRPKLKAIFKPVIKRDIIEKSNLAAFDAYSNEMKNAGLSTQLKGREINFFYILDGLRERIIFENGMYKVHSTEISFKQTELEIEIESHPERFSPNAMLRPLYQESILPNICYIGGNAEVNYWLQNYNVFKINNIAPPKISLRPSLWIIPNKIMQWMQKKGIDPQKLLISQDSENLLQFLGEAPISLETKIIAFTSLKKEIQDIVAQASIQDLNSLSDLGKSYEKLLKNAEKNIKEKQIEKQEEDYKKLLDIFHNYFDIKHMQERTLNTLEMLIKHENVVFTLKKAFSYTEATASIISL